MRNMDCSLPESATCSKATEPGRSDWRGDVAKNEQAGLRRCRSVARGEWLPFNSELAAESPHSCAGDGRAMLNAGRGRRPRGAVNGGAALPRSWVRETAPSRAAQAVENSERLERGVVQEQTTTGARRRLTFELTCGRQTAQPAGERQVERRVRRRHMQPQSRRNCSDSTPNRTAMASRK